jgi:hypothetical protein
MIHFVAIGRTHLFFLINIPPTAGWYPSKSTSEKNIVSYHDTLISTVNNDGGKCILQKEGSFAGNAQVLTIK